jgi:hypothetical protein
MLKITGLGIWSDPFEKGVSNWMRLVFLFYHQSCNVSMLTGYKTIILRLLQTL